MNDSGFEGLEDELGQPYWTSRGKGQSAVRPSTDGPRGGGEGYLDPAAVCNAGALSQQVEMPPYEAAGPLIAEVTYFAQHVEGVETGFDRAWKFLPETPDGWSTVRFCLGEAAYGEPPLGGPVEVRLSASEPAPNCLSGVPQGTIRIDHFDIRPAEPEETCVEPGSVRNGEAEVSKNGWQLAQDGDATAALAEGAGRLGTGGVRLYRPRRSTGRAAASAQVSVPLPRTLPGPALRFWWRGSSGQSFQMELGTFVELGDRGRSVDRLMGNNAERNNAYCLPPWTHGSVLDLTFALDDGLDEEAQLQVDDVEIVSDPDCGDSTDLLDPGFESAPNGWPGTYLFDTPDQAVIMRSDASLAHNGNGVLELSYWTNQVSLRVEQFLLVPESDGERGPELTFYSNVPVMPEATVEWVVGKTPVSRKTVTSGGGWQPNPVCLPPEWSGRWVRFQVRVEPGASSANAIGIRRIFLDDFALSTSPKCATAAP